MPLKDSYKGFVPLVISVKHLNLQPHPLLTFLR
jgi:hypothetical protein